MRKAHLDDLCRMMFDSATEGMYLVTPQGAFVAANPAFASLFGYESPEELVTNNSNPWGQLYCSPKQREKLFGMLSKQESVRGFRARVRKKDGSFITISENVSVVKDQTGDVIYFRGTVEEAAQQNQNSATSRNEDKELGLLLETAERDKTILLDIIDEVCVSHGALENVFINAVCDIVTALDSRRWWTRERSQRIASYVLKIADEMGLHEDDKSKLQIGALLHDIGQSVYHDGLIDKPMRLTTDELQIIRMHPEQGASVLHRTKELEGVLSMIRHHHERVDGKGYPDGLKGEEIPLGARIIHVATAYDSMIADRPYRSPRKREHALSEIVRCADTQFDPRVAEAALKVL